MNEMAGEAQMDPYGHRAESPREMPRRAWKDIIKRTYKRTWDDNVALVSAGVAFYSFFALLSLLALIVLTYGSVTDPRSVIEQMHRLTAILPSDIASLIAQQLLTVVESSAKAKGFGLLLAFLVAIYGGTNGAAAVITSVNIAYEEKEKRSLVRFYLIAIAMTATALLVTLAALAAAAAVAYLQTLLPEAAPVAITIGRIAAYLLLVPIAAGAAATLYRFGPSREDAKWEWITPGSLFAAIAWVLLTAAFGFYVAHLTNYKASYGSLAAVVALLTWMYFSAYAFVFGAELNSEIEHQTAKDSTTGEPRPMGERGAWAADNVATTDEIQDRPEEQREGQKLTTAQPTVAEEND
jgi:membrane protein